MPPKRHGRSIVHLQTRLGDTEYAVMFDTFYVANEFRTAVDEEAAFASIATIQDRLGHGSLTAKSESLVFAENIAEESVANQPHKLVPFYEVLLATVPPS
jgi:hypothetical protein